jgi:hypothetical protein
MRTAIARLLVTAVTFTAFVPIASGFVAQTCCHAKADSYCASDQDSMPGMEMASEDRGSGADVAQALATCPMHCCCVAGSGSAFSAEHPSAVIALTHVRSAGLMPDSKIFVSAGFSSHTDRGPPNSSSLSLA